MCQYQYQGTLGPFSVVSSRLRVIKNKMINPSKENSDTEGTGVPVNKGAGKGTCMGARKVKLLISSPSLIPLIPN